MILWHLGVTLLAVRYVYRDPAMDLRWVALGSLLPDLIDKPLGAVFFNDYFGSHRLFAHSMIFPVVLFFAVLLATGRGSRYRKGLIGLVIGSLFHLVLDAAWAEPEAFLWPLFGWSFPATDPSSLWPLIQHMAGQPLVWAGEVVGATYLIYLWRTHLQTGQEVRILLKSGTVAFPER